MNVDEIFRDGYKDADRYNIPGVHGGRKAYLTRKEAEIISLLVKGMRAKQIAWELKSSLHTVNTHLANIKEKLKCSNIFELGLFLGRLQEHD